MVEQEPTIMIAKTPFWNLNIGHLATIASMLLGGTGAYYGMKAELQTVDLRVARIESSITQLTSLAISSARQDQRLLDFERRIDRLESKMAPR